jgi:hypothetical protein
MHSYLVSQLAKQRHRELQAEQHLVRQAVALGKASQRAERRERRVRWVVQRVFRLRSALD